MSQWMKRLAAITLSIALLAMPLLLSEAKAQCRETWTAEVVALDQEIFWNRLGAFNPAGMIYALKRDVIDKVSGLPLTAGGAAVAGQVALRPDKALRPIVLRVNVGDCLQIHFTNLLNPARANEEQPGERGASIHVNGMQLIGGIGSDGSNVGANASSLVAPGGNATYTFYAEFENAYLLYNMGATTGAEGGGGTTSYGLFGAVNVEPSRAEWYRSQLTREEMDFATRKRPDGSLMLTADGHPVIDYDARYPNIPPFTLEGKAGLPIVKMTNGHEIVHSDVNAIITGPNRGNFAKGTFHASTPVNPNRERPFREFTSIFHDEAFSLQAFPAFFNPFPDGAGNPTNPLFHTLHGVRDGLGINYGIGGIGAEIVANRLGVGPMGECNECKYEEFFLTSWAVGDPGMKVNIPANNPLGLKATATLFAEDPANVHHSYINDHVKIRNVHAGPTEHHMFHLHSHQWVFSPINDNSNYLDGQAIGPGSGYTYDIAMGGSGNRNKTPGDAIYHCHFYPHFAQGMWYLWRNHDVFEQGTDLVGQCDATQSTCTSRLAFGLREARPRPGSRALPDGEIVAGTPIPAVVPLPGLPTAPMPGPVTVAAGSTLTPAQPGSQISFAADPGSGFPGNSLVDGLGNPDPKKNPGYPFFEAGVAGHRPPTPPMDLVHDGGLPRHIIAGVGANLDPNRTASVVSRLDFSKVLEEADAIQVPEDGTPAEKAAMAFHAIRFHDTFLPDGANALGTRGYRTNGQPPRPGAPYAEPCIDDNGDLIQPGRTPSYIGQTKRTPRTVQFGADNPRRYKGANIQLDTIFNKVGYHHPQQRIISLWEDVADTLSGARPPEPFVMRLNSNDCAEFWHTNLVPSIYELDDYQVRTPTDIIGQHIHLVKFDVTSADGSANGWNYEDGTLSPDEVRERIRAIQAGSWTPIPGGPAQQDLAPQPHPFFGSGPGNRWTGARTTVQRWFADPVLNNQGDDRTLGVVFTHDHFGPSSHQQVGLYATLLVEPAGSVWKHNETGELLGTRDDGGPTSWQAAILGGSNTIDGPSFREFFFEWSDFQHAFKREYTGQVDRDSFKLAINPSVRVEAADPVDLIQFLPNCPDGLPRPCPEAISAADIGMFVNNYRNEPIGLRVFDPDKINPQTGRPGAQADAEMGDLAFAFSSWIPRAIPEMNSRMADCVRDVSLADPVLAPTGNLGEGNLGQSVQVGVPRPCPQLTGDVGLLDPATPLIRTYAGDRVRIKLQTGATEESHNVTFHGLKWLQEFANVNSGWRNTQHMGIDEQFQLRTPVIPDRNQNGDTADYLYSVSSSTMAYWSGTWGLLRNYKTRQPDLVELPDNPIGLGPVVDNRADFLTEGFLGACPRNARRRVFEISAVRAADVLPTILPGAVDPEVSPEGRTLIYNSRPTSLLGFGEEPARQGPLHDPTALLYVHDSDLDPATGKLRAGAPIEPLIMRARAGECIEVRLTNRLPAPLLEEAALDNGLPDLNGWNEVVPIFDKGEANSVFGPVESKVTFNLNDVKPSRHVGIHPQLVEYDVTRSDGANVGLNPFQTAAPGETVRYQWYAGDVRLVNRRLVATPVEFGGVGLIPADKIEQVNKGLVGAMVILPANASWQDNYDLSKAGTLPAGERITRDTASVRAAAGRRARGRGNVFRDFVAVLHSSLQLRYAENAPVPGVEAEGRVSEDVEDSGQKGVNYRSEPLWFRLGIAPNTGFSAPQLQGADQENLFSNAQAGVGSDPQTPVFTANARERVRFHFVVPGGGHRNGVLALHGHPWDREPYAGSAAAIRGSVSIADNPTSQRIGSQEGVGPTSHYDIIPRNGAGGTGGVKGDYLYRMEDAFHNLQGIWGIFRVK